MILRPRMEPGARTPREHRRTRAAGQPADQREAEDQKQQGGGVEGHLSLIHSLPSLRSCFDRLSTNGGRESLGFLFQHRSIERRRSEERRAGKACVSRVRSRWSPDDYKKNKKNEQT